MSKTTWTYDVDAQALLKRLDELEGKNRKLEERLKNVSSAGKKTKNTLAAGFNDIEKSILDAAKSMGAFVASTLSVSQGLGVLRDYGAALESIASKNKAVGEGLKSFALLQEKGQVSRGVGKLAMVASRYDVEPDVAGDLAGVIQSKYGGDLDKALPDMETAFKMSKLGVAPETIKEMIIAAGQESFSKMAAQFYAVAENSPLDPKDVGIVTPAMSAFRDPMTAASVAAALREGKIDLGSIETMSRNVGLGLQVDSALRKKAVKVAGGEKRYESLSEIEQIEMMRRAVPDRDRDGKLTVGEVQKAGIDEKRTAQAFAALFETMPKLREFRASADSVDERYIDGLLAKLGEDPLIRRAGEANSLEVLTKWQHAIGPQGERAAGLQGMYDASAAQITKTGGVLGVSADTGQLSALGKTFAWMDLATAARHPDEGDNLRQSNVPGNPAAAPGAREQLDGLRESIQQSAKAYVEASDSLRKSMDELGKAIQGSAGVSVAPAVARNAGTE